MVVFMPEHSPTSMRAFSLIELLVALALTGMTLTAVAYSLFGIPIAVQNTLFEEGALKHARVLLGETYQTTPTPSATTTVGIYDLSRSTEEREDESLQTITAHVLWRDVFKKPISRDLSSIHKIGSTAHGACDSFIADDWSHPVRIRTHVLTPGSALPGTLPSGKYQVGHIVGTPTTLITTISSTTSSKAPTLMFFRAQGTSPDLTYIGGFDNASTSRIGFSAIAVNNDYVYVGNGFGSKSTDTCSDGVSCAQLHVFSGIRDGVLSRGKSISLSTTSLPFAITSAGDSASVTSITYYKEYVYVGLEKTSGGYEFIIFDVHDPSSPTWIGGIPVGRTVEGVTVRGTTAYISTDDPSAELLIVDVTDPQHPRKVGLYDAPGATGFGYGITSTVRNSLLRLGRSYSPNGSELQLIDVGNPARVSAIQNIDIGTAKDPQSIRSMVVMDTLLFTLSNHRLDFWNTTEQTQIQTYATPYLFPATSTGVSLTCRNNLLYLARTENGEGVIEVLQGS
jgi:type II secretory pathway pseudopilin PulG